MSWLLPISRLRFAAIWICSVFLSCCVFASAYNADQLFDAQTPIPDLSTFLYDFIGMESPTDALTSAPNLTSYLNEFKPTKKKSSWVPPGFEDLLAPQTTQVDIYYGAAYLISTLATFTPTEITFLDPAAIADKIPGLLDLRHIESILSGQMSVNSEKVCLRKSQKGCGKITPANVEVIFDASKFKADLFVASDLLSVRNLDVSKFLPRSDAGFSLYNSLNTAVTGQEGSDSNYNITNATTVSFRESRLLMTSNITKSENFTIDILAIQRELNGNEYQFGFLRKNSGSLLFISERNFLGVSLASSRNTRKGLSQSFGNDLQLFLESNSRVDILKDGRLISTNVYDTGNQILDTSALPDGAYDIVLRIRDYSGNVREEQRFYAKTNQLPLKDQVEYFLDFGEEVALVSVGTLPKISGNRFLRAGLSRRIFRDFGGRMGFVTDASGSLGEVGVFKLGRVYDVRFNAAVGNDGTWGANLRANIRLGSAYLTGSFRKSSAVNNDSLIGASLTQTNLNLTWPLGRSSLSVSARFNKRAAGSDRNFGLSYRFPTYIFGKQSLLSNLQVTRNNGDWLVLLSSRITLRRQRWSSEIGYRFNYDKPKDFDSQTRGISNLSLNWQDGDQFLGDVRATFRARDDDNNQFVESELDIASSYGRINLETVHSLGDRMTSYGFSFDTNIIANKDSVSIGGKSLSGAAVVIELEGDIGDAYFAVKIDQSIKDYVRSNKTTIIPLVPFRTYEISLVPKGESLVDFDNQVKTITLYPGNVVTLKWKASRVLVAFGQIVDAAGIPISNALIKGVVGIATTDDYGLFQAEIDSSTRQVIVKSRTSECSAVLPEFDSQKMIVTLGKLVCR